RAHALTPHMARSLGADSSVRIVPAESLGQGARVELLAGDTFPVDGVVETGESCVDRRWLTGESYPEAVRAGSQVHAGTTNLGGRLVVVAERCGTETRAA